MAVWQLTALAFLSEKMNCVILDTYDKIAYLPVGISSSRFNESARTPIVTHKIAESARLSKPNASRGTGLCYLFQKRFSLTI